MKRYSKKRYSKKITSKKRYSKKRYSKRYSKKRYSKKSKSFKRRRVLKGGAGGGGADGPINHINDDELLIKILSNLGTRDLANMRKVSTKFKRLGNLPDVVRVAQQNDLAAKRNDLIRRIGFDGNLLEGANEVIPGSQADKEIVLVAVQKNGRALRYASEALKADKEIVEAAEEAENY